jgi:ribA/ribD-fused uncharacterized protein
MALLSLDAPIAAVNHLEVHLRHGIFDNGRVIGQQLIAALGQQAAFTAVVSALKYRLSRRKESPSFIQATTLEEICRHAEAYFPEGFIEACKSGALTFYSDTMDWADNFSAFSIDVNGVRYPTVEHAYQAAKFDFGPLKDLIRNAGSPHRAKEIANDPGYGEKIRATWKKDKVAEMLKLYLLKVDQHEYVRKKLQATAYSYFVEDSPTDNFWGRGPSWSGLNMGGMLWMAVRESRRAGQEVNLDYFNALALMWYEEQARI